MKLLFATLTFIALTISSFSQENQLKLFYDTDIYHLDSNHKNMIYQWIEGLDKNSFHEVSITGAADDEGSEEYNLALSKKRIHEVETFIEASTQAGIEIQTNPLGELDNKGSDLELSRKSNRMVTITSKATSIFDSTDVKPQVFSFDPKKDFLKKTKGGVLIQIPAGTFVQPNGGKIFGRVELKVSEYLNTADFIRGGMHTSSNEGMLESGGMFDLNATYSGGRPVTIAHWFFQKKIFASGFENEW